VVSVEREVFFADLTWSSDCVPRSSVQIRKLGAVFVGTRLRAFHSSM